MYCFSVEFFVESWQLEKNKLWMSGLAKVRCTWNFRIFGNSIFRENIPISFGFDFLLLLNELTAKRSLLTLTEHRQYGPSFHQFDISYTFHWDWGKMVESSVQIVARRHYPFVRWVAYFSPSESWIACRICHRQFHWNLIASIPPLIAPNEQCPFGVAWLSNRHDRWVCWKRHWFSHFSRH